MSGVQFDHPAAAHVSIVNPEAGIVEQTSPRSSVAIVGFASSSTMDAPFNDPSFEIWGMNQLYRHIPRADRWFEIHANYDEFVVEGTDHVGWIRDSPIPVYMTKHYPDYPRSVRYPIERMIKRFDDYFTSSIAFMLALAIDEGFTRIDLFGIDLTVGSEYFYQKPCVEYYIGYANALGIDVGIPVASALCKQSHRYGYEKESAAQGPLHEEDLLQRRSKLLALKETRVTEINQLDGALAEIGHLIEGYQLRSRHATWIP